MNDLSRAIARDRDALNAAVKSVLDSGFVVMGPQHDAFQSALADYLSIPFAIGVASGTDALELAIKIAMPLGKCAVLTAANAGGYTTAAARRVGFSVYYADVDPASLCLSLATVEAALTDKIGVVVITHLYGNLTEIRSLVEICHARGVRVVEDCAQAIGARRHEVAAGAFGDLGAISFYPTKNLGALGDGGAVVTGSAEFAARVTQLKQYGWETKYRVSVPGGVNSRLDEIQAAFLLARLPQLDTLNLRRRLIIRRYVEAAAGGPLHVLPADGPHHAAHLAVALSPHRDETRDQLARLGVHTDVHFPVPDYRQPGFESDSPRLAVTEWATDQILSLPCFPELTDDEVDFVCDAIGSIS